MLASSTSVAARGDDTAHSNPERAKRTTAAMGRQLSLSEKGNPKGHGRDKEEISASTSL